MSLQQWHKNAWIHPVESSAMEVSSLLDLAQREITDGSLEGISSDGRFEHAYNAVRTLCQLALHAAGYAVPKGDSSHQRALETLKFTLGSKWSSEADHFEHCRRMRRQMVYERSGVTQPKDADELLAGAKKLHAAVQEWLQDNHPNLVGGQAG